MQGRRVVGSPSIAALFAAALAFRLLGPRCLRVRGAGLLLRLLLRAIQNIMFATVAMAALVDVLIAARADFSRVAGAASSIEALACLHVLSLGLVVGGFCGSLISARLPSVLPSAAASLPDEGR